MLARWLVTFVGTAVLAALLWFFGPLITALEPAWVRLAGILALVGAWAAANLLIDRRRGARDRTLTEGVTRADDDVAALRERLATALSAIRKARGKSFTLYEQPWYVIIGPPGAGKTTALLNAGLRFPLGEAAVAGVGGTRLCDWWFAEDAVLIDTAGRYTMQDADNPRDRVGWTGFLDLLKRTRTRQPLNGVIVAIALSDIAAAPQEERLAHARAIRRRIKEITERLSLRLPVYAVFTKADLISGFSEFFADLDRERRDQVWGTTFATDSTAAGDFIEAFRALVARLNARLFERLQAERNPDRRAVLAGFPAQVASLEAPLAAFLQEGFGGSRADPPPFLRGVYMASGTQDGTPIDRLTGVLSRAFGLDQRRGAALRPEKGRSYFLGKLLKQVVFGEAMLVARDPGAAWRRRIARITAYGLVPLAVLLCGLLLWQVRITNQALIAQTEAALTASQHAAAGATGDPVGEANLARLLPVLDQAAALQSVTDRPASWRWLPPGLSQADKLGTAARLLYRHALERLLLPRLIWRLEAQMQGNLNRPDFLYQATRVYLMLGGQGTLDPDLVQAWMALDWRVSMPGPAAAGRRAALSGHLASLLSEPLPAVKLDGTLVAAARATFGQVPLAARVYSRIRPSTAAQRLPPWRPAEALGPSGMSVFVRPSGQSLTEGVPGFFTPEGFEKVLRPALANLPRAVAAESWVLGQKEAADPGGAQRLQLENDVIGLYTNDYIRQWDALLADLDPVPLRSLPQAAHTLGVLAGAPSPIRALLTSMAKQLLLAPVPAAPAADSATKAQLQSVLGGPDIAAATDRPGLAIEQHYKPLRDFIAGGSAAPIDVVLKLIADLQAQLAQLAALPPGAPPPAPSGADPAQILRTEALRQPPPVSRWLQDMASSGVALRGGGARQHVAEIYNGAGAAASPGTLCKQAVTGRYPFTPTATSETPIADFDRLFAPGGLLDGFFNTQLRPYVDTSVPLWVPQPLDGVAPPIAPDQLTQFQRAALIRDLFFPDGGSAPAVRFDITPTDLDPGATQASLDLDGLIIPATHSPGHATQVTWPGPSRMLNVRLVFDPPATAITASGPWALFRLFAQGSLAQAGSPELYTLSFRQGARQAVFEIRAASVINPFAPGVLQEFRCPVLP